MKVLHLFAKFEYYKSIDEMPVWSWFKVQETNDLRYVLHKFRDITKSEGVVLEKIIGGMTDEYIDTFGVSDEFRKSVELRRDIRVLEIEFFITKDRSNLTFIDVKKAELRALMKTQNKGSANSVKAHVAKFVGGWPDFKLMTVKEFYSIIQELKRQPQQKTG